MAHELPPQVFPDTLARIQMIVFQQDFPDGEYRVIVWLEGDGLRTIKLMDPSPNQGETQTELRTQVGQNVMIWNQQLRQPLQIQFVWLRVLAYNAQQILASIEFARPNISIHSTGDEAVDRYILESLASARVPNDHERAIPWIAFEIAVGEDVGIAVNGVNLDPTHRLAPDSRKFYNLGIRQYLDEQRARLRWLLNPQIDLDQIGRVEEYEVPFLPPRPEVIARVSEYAVRFLISDQLNVFPLERSMEIAHLPRLTDARRDEVNNYLYGNGQ